MNKLGLSVIDNILSKHDIRLINSSKGITTNIDTVRSVILDNNIEILRDDVDQLFGEEILNTSSDMIDFLWKELEKLGYPLEDIEDIFDVSSDDIWTLIYKHDVSTLEKYKEISNTFGVIDFYIPLKSIDVSMVDSYLDRTIQYNIIRSLLGISSEHEKIGSIKHDIINFIDEINFHKDNISEIGIVFKAELKDLVKMCIDDTGEFIENILLDKVCLIARDEDYDFTNVKTINVNVKKSFIREFLYIIDPIDALDDVEVKARFE